MNMTDAVFGSWYLWYTVLQSLCMVAALGTIVVFMLSEAWHKPAYYKHEHDAEWIKAHAKK